jgi:hypothetical protein
MNKQRSKQMKTIKIYLSGDGMVNLKHDGFTHNTGDFWVKSVTLKELDSFLTLNKCYIDDDNNIADLDSQWGTWGIIS